MNRIAVIGAGIAGLTVARRLARHNEVTVFEKSRGVGGRVATRYAGEYEFDHGAQFFTARSPEFLAFLRPLIENGVVSDWQARFAEFERGEIVAARQWDDEHPHYVGVPRMNAIGKSLALGIDIRLRTTVAHIGREDNSWTLFDSEEAALGQFDWVVVAVPAAQTAALVAESSLLRKRSEDAHMLPCFSLLLAFERAPELPFEAALVRNADISWISVNNSKPGRGKTVCLVVHSTNAWADAHVDDDEEAVISHLLAELSDVAGIPADISTYSRLHRWRYANVGRQQGPHCCIDAELRLATCGDWLMCGRVEAAFNSALALSDALESYL